MSPIIRYVLSGLMLVWASSGLAGTVELMFEDARTGGPLSDVVVMVEGASRPEQVTADTRAPADTGFATISQLNRAFDPALSVIPRGTEVAFPNNDNTQHHVYSFSVPKPFNIELYAGQPEAPVLFDKAGVVELGCNIHDQMQAFIVITDAVHVSRSGASGTVRLEVPDQLLAPGGELEVRIWHARLEDNSQSSQRLLTGPWPIKQTIALDLTPVKPGVSGLEGLQKRFREL